MGDRAERLLPFEITVCGLRDLDGCDDLGRIAERLDLECFHGCSLQKKPFRSPSRVGEAEHSATASAYPTTTLPKGRSSMRWRSASAASSSLQARSTSGTQCSSLSAASILTPPVFAAQCKECIPLQLCAPHGVDVLMTAFFAIAEKDSMDQPQRTGLARDA